MRKIPCVCLAFNFRKMLFLRAFNEVLKDMKERIIFSILSFYSLAKRFSNENFTVRLKIHKATKI